MQTPNDASIEKPWNGHDEVLSKATTIVAYCPLGLEKMGSEIRPWGVSSCALHRMIIVVTSIRDCLVTVKLQLCVSVRGMSTVGVAPLFLFGLRT